MAQTKQQNEKWVVPHYNGEYFHNYLISDLGRLLTNQKLICWFLWGTKL